MSTVFNLPDLGEGLTDSEIVSWLVSEGDTVRLNQPIAEVETAKATVEVPSPYAGVIAKLHAQAGDTVLVGAPLVEYDLGEGASQAVTVEKQAVTSGKDENPAEEKEERLDVLVGSVVISKGNAKRTPRAWQSEPFVRDPQEAESLTVKAAPPVRVYAKQRGINIADVPHTDTVTRTDIDAFIARAGEAVSISGPSPQQTQTGEKNWGVRVEKVQGIRKFSAQAMTKSYLEAPHATVFLDVDVTRSLELVRKLKGSENAPSFLSLVCRAVVDAAKLVPETNASFNAEKNEITFFESVNLGIAMNTPKGLVVASVDHANDMSAPAISAKILELRDKAMAGTLTPKELTSSTISISNVGVFGVDAGTPIINPGESLILALGAVRKKPWEHNGEIALREVVTLAASFDHRIIDGAEASRFIKRAGALLEEPGLMLVG